LLELELELVVTAELELEELDPVTGPTGVVALLLEEEEGVVGQKLTSDVTVLTGTAPVPLIVCVEFAHTPPKRVVVETAPDWKTVVMPANAVIVDVAVLTDAVAVEL